MRRPFACTLLIGLILSLVIRAASPAPVSAATIHHYEYVFTAGFIYVYDMDNNHSLLKTVAVPTTAGVRGAVASVATGMLYISYGSDGNSGGFQLAYNLSTDQVVWTTSYSHGIDSQSISLDGTKIYMPSGELSSGGTVYVESSSNGSDIATILSGGVGPHNSIVSPGGSRVYIGDRDFNLASGSPGVNDFDFADTTTNLVVGRVTPLKSGARPFTINSTETLAFITLTGFLGFQVGDLTAGNVIYTVTVNGSNIPGFTTQTSATTPSHGISLSPDDKEIYLIDEANNYVHVFDVSGLPASAPVQVADIKLVNSMAGNEVGCTYDCGRAGWLLHSRDGRFVYVGDSGDVIDTLTRKTIATLPQLANSRQHIEIDFQDSTPIWAATSRSGIGYINPLPPTFTTRITSPNLGSTVSGANVAILASVITTGTLSGVDLYKDGILYQSTTASPYTFSWDTTKDANGPHTITVTAQDATGTTTSFSATFTVNNVSPTPPSITTTSLPSGTQNTAYSATLAALGGTTPYTWSILSGSLPAGLTLASSTGTISGTPTATGTASFTVQVTDANSLAATKALSLTVGTTPSITTTSLASGTQNTAYSARLSASGGTTPYTWSIISGSLPAGLTLAPRSGRITGTPTATGTASFTVQVTDAHSLAATKALSLTVGATPSITTTSLPSGTQNAAFTATLAASGGTTPYSWSIISGSLPAGLTLAPSTGTISGTPTATGTASFTVQVTDANSLTATKALSLTVGATPSITTTSLPSGTQNTAYSATLAAAGGTTPYSWSVISGSLPAGLTLASSTGTISGTPTATGTANFTVLVTGANSLTATKVLSLTISTSGGGSGAIALVQSNAIQGSGVGSVSAAFPAGNTPGNLIIGFVRLSSTAQTVTVTDSAGNVYTDAVTQGQTADGHQVHIFYAKNILGGANTVKAAFSTTNNHPWLAIYEYSGLNKTTPLDQTAHAQGSSGAASSGAAAVTVSANELLFAATGLPASYTGTATAGTGYTMLQRDTSGSTADNEGEVVSTTGTYATTFSLSPGTNWTAVLATFKP